ncbi:MAG: diaminopimelate decarboxylase [Clostridiales Family XIII bacterium]|jgi:diaminopimelate decarboxylase|nr:diaminopimelate decarboxylase [Clostridiales Family XIII bacterium]
MELLYDNLAINEAGHLTVGGVDAVYLAEKYGTPLYVLDEDKIRQNCRLYTKNMAEQFGEGSLPLFAGKSLCFKGLYRVIEEEGMCADVVSPGELYTALAAGFPPERLFFHGNNKTDEDIRYGVDSGVGYFVADNYNELDILNAYAGEKGIRQKVLLRVTPGIDSHTLEAINTGKVDCQFGSPIETGQAARFVKKALAKENLDIQGYHFHIGSQIFDIEPFCRAVNILLNFALEIRSELGFTARIFNLGGGFGVRYADSDPQIDIPANIRALAEHLKEACTKCQYPLPRIYMEPGRSIVGNAGLTLYTVGGVKPIEGYRSYVTVDGGMTDNPRYALYKAKYTVLPAGLMNDAADFTCTIAGRCCESGDLIQEHVTLPEPHRSDILAVLTTGAYNFSMSSNYNRLCRPAIVMVSGGQNRPAVRRQTFEDLVACDL